MRIGLTGGIAAGKSEVERILRARGVPVLNTDDVAHEVMRPDGPAFPEIVEAFGTDILTENGRIDRKKLGEVVFADPAARQRLNRSVHPHVGRVWRAWLAARTEPLAVVSIPLLFECGLEHDFDGVLCVWAPETLMKDRLLRRGFTDGQAEQRIRSQLPVDEKAARATWVLENTNTVSHLESRVEHWCRDVAPMENP